MTLPYNRALHPDDYNDPWLAPHVEKLYATERLLSSKGLFYRKDHQHRSWEYANLLAILDDLQVPKTATIHDTGSGGSYFPLHLKLAGYDVSVSDSMAYGDIEPALIEQCLGLGIEIPMVRSSIEGLPAEMLKTLTAFDVTVCVSTIEHVDASLFHAALSALTFVTKPGGYIYLTTDYFSSEAAHAVSPHRGIQHTIVTPHTVVDQFVTSVNDDADGPRVRLVGNQDFTYRGDFVNNYSFVSLMLQKRPFHD